MAATDASIALNRFGLGARPDESIPDNPKAWLKHQIEAFDPKPAALASVPPRASTVTRKKRGQRGPRTLVFTAGPLTGTKITLSDQPILIGRADDSTLVLDDDFASTRHARLSLRGSDWYVEDLGSTNGTYLDRAKVTAPLRVPLGAPIRIGKTVIELRT